MNFLGQLIPAVAALFAIPTVVRALGVERFALLSLAWTMLGYFSFFDLGVGKATTNYVARLIDSEDKNKAFDGIVVSAIMNAAIGLAFTVLAISLASTTVRLLNIPHSLDNDARSTILLLAVSIPIITVGGTFRSALEAVHRFDVVNIVKAPSNALIFLIPLVGVYFSLSFPIIIAMIVLSRLASTIAYLLFLREDFTFSLGGFQSFLLVAKSLFRYGGWITVSNMLGPILSYGERLIIAGVVSIGALTYYSAPYDMISKVAIIPSSLALTLFPQLSASTPDRFKHVWDRLVIGPVKYLIGLLTPLTAFVIFFSQEILRVWLGVDFSSQSGHLLQILAAAFFFNAFAYISLTAVQGLGRPEMKAKLDLVQTVLFLAGSWVCIRYYGINGAAFVKLLVFALDAASLYWFSRSILKITKRPFLPKSLQGVALFSLFFFSAGFLVESVQWNLTLKISLYAVLTVLFALVFWKSALDGLDRVMVRNLFVGQGAKKLTGAIKQ